MINTEWVTSAEKDALPLIFSHMKWVQDEHENRFHLVTQTNLDCIFELVPHPTIEKRGEINLISVVKIDNMYTDYWRPDSPHLFHEPYPLEQSYVTERLIR